MKKKDGNRNIKWHDSTISKEDRQLLHGHKSMIIWFTGLSGSGKSTIANSLQYILYKKGISVYLLDGDNLRYGINKNLSFSEEDRRENIRRTAEIGKLFVDAGIVVIAALISPYENERQHARSLFNKTEFVEVFVNCPIEVCKKRDPKGLYEKVKSGEIKGFTGIDQTYEEPKKPDITVYTDKQSIEECTKMIIDYLIEKLEQ
ncbi:adenylyl-sulfate kinase [Bacillus sp. FJAT-49711]|uniref:adenylyl-sulfate kinase n=1 Tax=Bacillus sp. FJAT-49711 TaxID=2833585 RepID=UPI001BC9A2EB|nr:adenylyl-sulfate kinase [Bacillus sp. FJAT-49711]MBS4216908.1 adenylyl-sulfate kinase [Bacillus sp. FJAT-49711]